MMERSLLSFVSIHDATLLADLIRAAQGNLRVKWSKDGGDTIQEGVLRAFTHPGGAFLDPTKDNIFLAHLWISSTFEIWLPVREVLDLMDQGLFVIPIGERKWSTSSSPLRTT
jgi:hypothetical protein